MASAEIQVENFTEIVHLLYTHWADYTGDRYVVHQASSSKGAQGLHHAEPEPQPGDLIEIFRGFYSHWVVYVGGGYVVHLAPLRKGTQGLHHAEAENRGNRGAVGNRGPQHSSCSPTGSWFLSATRRHLGVSRVWKKVQTALAALTGLGAGDTAKLKTREGSARTQVIDAVPAAIIMKLHLLYKITPIISVLRHFF
ncbi:uncharacterized protein LOC102390273 isoform X3 [Bubalus bubalis]|uniref:uncharacterized protein LOC102390273 isoform X3 n=1 Tax=Bubalus bubalis TaxID=89462 RepID=UPI001D1215E8|nr:uncharacterized protein LOC102390273 isoform X3 [Bubalus bubalis]